MLRMTSLEFEKFKRFNDIEVFTQEEIKKAIQGSTIEKSCFDDLNEEEQNIFKSVAEELESFIPIEVLSPQPEGSLEKGSVSNILFIRESQVEWIEEDITKSEDGDIEKGEGDRGGKVIGHTKSGKPIYAKNANHKLYSGFTKEDHKDAAKIHDIHARGNRSYNKFNEHIGYSKSHERAIDSTEKSLEFDIEKSRYGRYKDTAHNRKMGRVGQTFGQKKSGEEGVKDNKTFKQGDEFTHPNHGNLIYSHKITDDKGKNADYYFNKKGKEQELSKVKLSEKELGDLKQQSEPQKKEEDKKISLKMWDDLQVDDLYNDYGDDYSLIDKLWEDQQKIYSKYLKQDPENYISTGGGKSFASNTFDEMKNDPEKFKKLYDEIKAITIPVINKLKNK